MKNIPIKVDGVDTLPADTFNQIAAELENAMTDTGQTLSGADLSQLSKTIANMVASGDFYTDSGAADAYVLGTIGSKQGPTSYEVGTRVRFIVGVTNTGASTVNVDALGVQNIKTNSAIDPIAGNLTAGQIVELEYDGTDFILQVQASGVFSADFTSTEQTITSVGSLNIAHLLGVAPSLVQPRIICKTAEFGYSIGDEVLVHPSGTSPDGGAAAGWDASFDVDATNVNVHFGSTASALFTIANKTTGVRQFATNANWKLIVRAWV